MPYGCGVTDVSDRRLQGAEGDGEELKTFQVVYIVLIFNSLRFMLSGFIVILLLFGETE